MDHPWIMNLNFNKALETIKYLYGEKTNLGSPRDFIFYKTIVE